jgi:SSS family solute:Na+ symporter
VDLDRLVEQEDAELQPAGLVPLHYIDFMLVTLTSSVVVALGYNRLVLGRSAQLIAWRRAAA